MTDGRGEPAGADGGAELQDRLQRLLRNGRANAVVAWLLVAVLVAVFVKSVLEADYQWILFVGVLGFVVLFPPIAYRDRQVMLPSELLVIALFPVLVRGLVGGTVGTFATYVSLAALALLVIVELHTFTELRVTHWFAVVLVVQTTMAAVAAWTVFRWNADRYLGTAYLADNEALMMEWLYVILAGLAAGVLFDVYFRRRDRWLWLAIRRTVGR